MVMLSTENVLRIYEKVMQRTVGLCGVRDRGLLESAVMSCQQTFDGKEAYPTVVEKAARLAFAISKNHPFYDGNKRVAVVAMLTMLRLNGVQLQYTQRQLACFGLDLADGNLIYSEVRRWVLNTRV